MHVAVLSRPSSFANECRWVSAEGLVAVGVDAASSVGKDSPPSPQVVIIFLGNWPFYLSHLPKSWRGTRGRNPLLNPCCARSRAMAGVGGRPSTWHCRRRPLAKPSARHHAITCSSRPICRRYVHCYSHHTGKLKPRNCSKPPGLFVANAVAPN